MKIAILIASYNRVAITLRGLRSLMEPAAHQKLATLEIFLVDDASSDGTGAAVKRQFPQIHVIEGTGSLFWNRGMCLAYATAKTFGPFDAYLLFNDDVELMPGALERAISIYIGLNRHSPAAVVGALCSRSAGQTTYGGYDVVSKFRPLTFRTIRPNKTVQECDTFNGNFVLIPAGPMDEVGGPDPAYHHQYGDIDLGFALRERSCKIYLLPDHIGFCELSPPLGNQPLKARLRAIFAPQDPLSDQIHMSYKRYSPWLATMLAGVQVIRRVSRALFPRNSM